MESWSSLVVQWLGLSAFTAVARVQSLVRELRYCKPRDVAIKKKKKKLASVVKSQIAAERAKTSFVLPGVKHCYRCWR